MSTSKSQEEDVLALSQAESARLDARPYQIELLNKAIARNIVVCLGTGTGKTFISVLLIKELSYQIRKGLESGGQRTFFLVNTVPLVSQQKKVIEQNTDLAVGGYVGEMGVDFWDDKKWQQELKTHQVLVMTAQIFVDLLGHGKVQLPQVNLIVFDECHHAKKEHPYAQVMKYFDGYQQDELPRILGLTASIVNGKVKPYKIESEIRNLEEILRAACETSNDDNVNKFATKPSEIHERLPNEENESLSCLIQEVVVPWQDFLNDYRSNSESLKVAKSIVKECSDTMTTLGALAAYRVTEDFLSNGRQYSRDDDPYDQLLLEYTATQLRQLKMVYKSYIETMPDDEMEHLPSSKVKRIAEILKEYGKQQEYSQAGLCGIVFVERRYTAVGLCEQLNLLSKKDEDLAFIKCDYVVGHGTVGSSVSPSSANMNWKQQEKVLRKFRQHEINLLVATSVVEEGLDVPRCNLVVRFDFPKTYQSYVQSKGRARAKDSQYVILISKEDDNEEYLQMYKAIEEYLANVCQDRPLPTEEDSSNAVDTDLLRPYRTTKGATLRMGNSISMLDKYCSKLPGDRFTPLNAEYTIDEVGSQAFQATVKLPMNSPIKKKIKGDAMPSKQQAKMAAAYKTCIKLYKQGELNDYLLPVEDLSDEDSDVDMDTAEEQGRPKRGTKRSKQIYPRKVPKVFEDSLPKPGKKYFLYAFTKTRPNEEGSLLKYGILMASRLPEIRPFVLYPDEGKVVISISECCVNTPILSTTDISRMEKFNAQLMSEVLKISCQRNPAKADGYYIVPLQTSSLNEAEIDFDELRNSRYTTADIRKVSNRVTLENHESIITPQHRTKERFVVEKVCTDLTPCSSFPDPSKAKTYEEYFRTNYDLKTIKMKQPLILVKSFPQRINFLVDRKKTKAENKAAKQGIHFIPEHCSLHPFPASVLLAAAELPSILHRLTSILLVREVRDLVAEGCSKPQAYKDTREENLPPIGTMEKSENMERGKSQLQMWFSNLPTNTQCADSYLLLQALTTKGAGDAFDLERLEMLGDAFLKQAVSICLFYCYPFKDEGKLTRRKVKQISNLNLCNVSIRKKFPTFMQNTMLDRKSWLLPWLHLTPEEPISTAKTMEHLNKKRKNEEEEQERPAITEQLISDKSVADTIEALIGAYLVSCGYQEALNFLNFLGVKVYPDNVDQSRVPSSTNYSVFEIPKFLPLTENPNDHKIMTEELKGFERRINYPFNDKLYLVQALTHASYRYNKVAPDCYQRLEFLGDAVLDFLVTECLYSSNPNLSPGQLTDLRQALVNNNIFAKIAVEYDYHKYLKYTSPQWFKKINDFVQQLDDDQKDGKPQVDDDPFIIMSDGDEEGIEAPKVLGDIFESVAGAVFLDSGMDVVKTWQVYYRMMKPCIDHYSRHVPCNPVRWVHEADSEATFSDAVVQGDKILCQLTIRWGEYTGKGANKKIAKIHAARLARDAYKLQHQC